MIRKVSGVRFRVSAGPLAASVQSDRKRNFKKQILDFGMRILDLRYSIFIKLTERRVGS
ncbi:hypothetical protein D1AOALGA4SA_8345 [Olavius algarvensis Delta 1 endosymbiont]|nr:hypothetical protein D1AOALGA4SA_8345 [Olavius algarvensis Delta 1 endosymbiont]